MVLLPKLSGDYIVHNAKYVKVRPAGIKTVCDEIVKGILSKEIDIENFSQHEFHPKPTDKRALNWIFLIDALNFCFWTPGDDTKWRVEGHTGYYALLASINRAMVEEGLDITNPHFYSNLTVEKMEHILRSDDGETKCPLIKERVECLQECGKKLIDKFDGQFENCVKKCHNSAMLLLDLVVNEFPCFRDEAIYAGQKVGIYKRAQVLIGDVWACFGGLGLGQFDDIYKITMFADYRVPQVLIHFGALEYSTELLHILDTGILLKNGSPQEVEIRGASIHIVEQVKDLVLKELKQNHPNVPTSKVNSILVDHFLWGYRRRHAKELEYIPFHKTLSIYY